MRKIVSLDFYETKARAKGIALGENKEKFATVKRMLKRGKSLQEIVLITDLPLAKVQELQTEVKLV